MHCLQRQSASVCVMVCDGHPEALLKNGRVNVVLMYSLIVDFLALRSRFVQLDFLEGSGSYCIALVLCSALTILGRGFLNGF